MSEPLHELTHTYELVYVGGCDCSVDSVVQSGNVSLHTTLLVGVGSTEDQVLLWVKQLVTALLH